MGLLIISHGKPRFQGSIVISLFLNSVLKITVIKLVDPLSHHPSNFFAINPGTERIIRPHHLKNLSLREGLLNMTEAASPHQQLGSGRVVLVGDDGQEGIVQENPHGSKGFGFGGC